MPRQRQGAPPAAPPPPVLASIGASTRTRLTAGTVLIDIFEPTPRDTDASQPDDAHASASISGSGGVQPGRHSSGSGSSAPRGAAVVGGVPAPTPPLLQVASTQSQAQATHHTQPAPSAASVPSSLSPSPRGNTPQVEAASEVPRGGRMVIGGGGMYALIGGRVWLAPTALRTVIDRSPGTRRGERAGETGTGGRGKGLEISREKGEREEVRKEEGVRDSVADTEDEADEADAGDEFDDLPLELEEQLRSYGPDMWVFNRVPGARVPRARIGYDNVVRSYAHLVKPVTRTASELAAGPLASAEWLHVSPPYSSTALLELVSELERTSWRPRIVFEPAPTSCHPAEREAFERAAPCVEVLSPNHEELLSLYDLPAPSSPHETVRVVEDVVTRLLSAGVGPGGRGTMAVRCSALGACIGTVEGGVRWVPSFFEGEQERVRDVTGAGNAFIGGYIAGLSLTGDAYAAALHGTVSASFVIEQLGPPTLSVSPDGERWNGDSAERRLAVLSERVGWT